MDTTDNLNEFMSAKALRIATIIATFFVASAGLTLWRLMWISNQGDPMSLFAMVGSLSFMGAVIGHMLAPKIYGSLRHTRTAAGTARLLYITLLCFTVALVVCVSQFFSSPIAALSGKMLILSSANLVVCRYCLARRFAKPDEAS